MGIAESKASKELSGLLEQLDRLVSSLGLDLASDDISAGWTPRADVYESDDELLLLVELPGVMSDGLTVELAGDVLTLQGIREKLKNGQFHRMERSAGKFIRTFTLPTLVTNGEVQGKLHDGVLEIRVPRRLATRTKVDITSKEENRS